MLTKTTLLSFDDKNVTLRPVPEKRSLDNLVVGSRFNCCNNPVVLVFLLSTLSWLLGINRV